MTDLPVRVREMFPEDENFIYNSWLKSYRNARAVRNMENPAYFKEQGKLIRDMLDTCNVTVVCNQNDSTQILGYMVSQNLAGILCIHYLYIKQPYRGNGLAKMLVKARGHEIGKPGVYTHHTALSDRLSGKFRFMYNPYIAFETREKDTTDYAAIED